MMTMNDTEFKILDMIFSSMQDEGSTLDMHTSVMNKEREDNTGYSNISVNSLSEDLGITMNSVKGYLGSLAKKNVIICDDYDHMILISNYGILIWYIYNNDQPQPIKMYNY